MKPIQPIDIWINGGLQIATILNLFSVFDNFSNSAVITYELRDANDVVLTNGNLTIDGQDYQDWDNDPSANDWIYTWAAGQLNLTLL